MNKRKSNNVHLVFLVFLASVFFSCSNHDVYLKYHTIQADGWSKDSVYVFDVSIIDTLSSYNVYVNVRNRGEYESQNLWLFVDRVNAQHILVKDTINFYLADQYGKWLGSGVGSVYEMPVLYQENIRFKNAGIYRYQISHAMRYDLLAGINDIGLRVEKNE